MSIRDDFFEAQAKASLWDVAVSIKRGNPLPLDANSVFKALGTIGGEDYAGSLREYAASNPVAYPGQICAVVGEAATTIYYLDQNLEVQQVGIIPTGDEKTIEVTPAGAISLLGAKDAATGTLPMIDSETGKLVWKTLEDIGAGDGNDNTTYEFAFADQKITVTPKFNGIAQDTIELDLGVFVTGEELTEAIKDFVTTDTTYTVAEGEKLLKLDGTEFSTVASLKYVEATETATAKIQLCGIDGTVVSELDATPFIKDGMLEDVAYDADTKVITFTWNTAAGTKTDSIEIKDLIDVYTAGNGLTLADNKFSVKVADSSETFLSVDENGVKLSGVQAAIDSAKSDAATDAQTKADAAKAAAIADAASKYYGKAEVYTQTQINTLLEGIQGGASESAAAVKTQLDAYKKIVNAEVWGDEAGTGTDGNSRIDALASKVETLENVGAQANVIETVSGGADNRLTITTNGKAVTIDDANLRTDIADAKKAGTDAAAAATTNAQAITGHDTRIDTLEKANTTKANEIKALQEADVTANSKILALETTVNNETSGVAATYAIAAQNQSNITVLGATVSTNTSDIAALKTTTGNHTTDITNIKASLENVYTKTEADSAISNAVADKITTAALEPYAKAADVASTYATIAALEAEAKTARAAETANADAIAVLIGNIEGDKAKSARDIAKEEVALIVGAAPEAMNTLEEVANWIGTDTTGAAAMASDIVALKTTVDTGDKTVTKYVSDAIGAIPMATAEIAGLVKASEEITVAEDGKLGIAKVSTDLLVQGTSTLVLNGGNASAKAAE
jgi:hypothetical protein